MQNSVVANKSWLGKLGGGCQRATSWGAEGEALLWPRSQVSDSFPGNKYSESCLKQHCFQARMQAGVSGFTQAEEPGNPGCGLWRVQVFRQQWVQKP